MDSAASRWHLCAPPPGGRIVSDQHPPLTPAEAVDRLEALHADAVAAVRTALARFIKQGIPPTP